MTNDRNIPHYRSLRESYPFYLSEHQHPVRPILHVTGTGLIGVWITWAIVQGNAWWLLMVPLGGYGFAWAGHFFVERKEPATFQYPAYSLASDFILFWQMLTGREKFLRSR
jgi:hypothetical protein